MESSYRTAPGVAAPPSAITYCAYDRPALLGITAMVVLFVVSFLWLAVRSVSTITLDCSRARGVCTFLVITPLRDAVEVSRPLASIQRVEVNNGKYGCYLWLSANPSLVGIIPPRSGSCAERRAQKAAIDEFLADGSSPTVHVDYNRPSPVALFWLFCSVAAMLVVTFQWQRATVRFEWASGVVVLERSRWPFPPLKRSFLLDEVTGAGVRMRSWGASRVQHFVTVRLASGEDVQLLGVWGGSNNPDRPAAAAAWIRHAIENKERFLRPRSASA